MKFGTQFETETNSSMLVEDAMPVANQESHYESRRNACFDAGGSSSLTSVMGSYGSTSDLEVIEDVAISGEEPQEIETQHLHMEEDTFLVGRNSATSSTAPTNYYNQHGRGSTRVSPGRGGAASSTAFISPAVTSSQMGRESSITSERLSASSQSSVIVQVGVSAASSSSSRLGPRESEVVELPQASLGSGTLQTDPNSDTLFPDIRVQRVSEESCPPGRSSGLGRNSTSQAHGQILPTSSSATSTPGGEHPSSADLAQSARDKLQLLRRHSSSSSSSCADHLNQQLSSSPLTFSPVVAATGNSLTTPSLSTPGAADNFSQHLNTGHPSPSSSSTVVKLPNAATPPFQGISLSHEEHRQFSGEGDASTEASLESSTNNMGSNKYAPGPRLSLLRSRIRNRNSKTSLHLPAVVEGQQTSGVDHVAGMKLKTSSEAEQVQLSQVQQQLSSSHLQHLRPAGGRMSTRYTAAAGTTGGGGASNLQHAANHHGANAMYASLYHSGGTSSGATLSHLPGASSPSADIAAAARERLWEPLSGIEARTVSEEIITCEDHSTMMHQASKVTKPTRIPGSTAAGLSESGVQQNHSTVGIAGAGGGFAEHEYHEPYFRRHDPSSRSQSLNSQAAIGGGGHQMLEAHHQPGGDLDLVPLFAQDSSRKVRKLSISSPADGEVGAGRYSTDKLALLKKKIKMPR
ncbi:unnamed protein product [Amoebophrya sp. A25]|nr:unnamed protein product [Amoebophrya sp. A25]|eukprot:GSA25T00009860001.1